MLKDLVNQCHSYRGFYKDVRIPSDELKDVMGIVRVTDSAANAQPLKYRIICDPDQCAKVFPTVGWAAALKDRSGPEPGERPSTCIAIICDLSIGKNKWQDERVTSRTIMLNAVKKGYGGYMIGNYRRSELLEILNLGPGKYCVGLLLALGKPKEEMVMVPVDEDQNTVYYRDENQTHYVPKRSSEDILI